MKPQTIYKYEIPFGDKGIVEMPSDARPLSVGMQGETMYAWALVSSDNEVVIPFLFSIRGTGHPVSGNEGEFLGTVFAGQFVWHVFWNYGVGQLE